MFLFEGLGFLHPDFDDSLSIIISGFQQRTGGEMCLVQIQSPPYDSQGAVKVFAFGRLVKIQSVPRGNDWGKVRMHHYAHDEHARFGKKLEQINRVPFPS